MAVKELVHERAGSTGRCSQIRYQKLHYQPETHQVLPSNVLCHERDLAEPLKGKPGTHQMLPSDVLWSEDDVAEDLKESLCTRRLATLGAAAVEGAEGRFSSQKPLEGRWAPGRDWPALL